jgi:hypothetical protein
MNVRFYIDSANGQPHIFQHGVEEDEVEQVLENRGEDRPGERAHALRLARRRMADT